MKRLRRALALVLLWAVPVHALPVGAAPLAMPKPASLTMAQIVLLSQHKYEVHSDGTVWEHETHVVVDPADLPAILARLESTQRLTALLRLRLILSASDGERYLSPSEREQIRAIVRDNWPYFTMTMRKGLRSYFSLQELEQMSRTPPAEEHDVALEMKDPAIDVSQDESQGGSPFAPPTSAAAQAAAVQTSAPPPPAAPAPAPKPAPAAAPVASVAKPAAAAPAPPPALSAALPPAPPIVPPAVISAAPTVISAQPTVVPPPSAGTANGPPAPGAAKAAVAAQPAPAAAAPVAAPPPMPDFAAVPLPPAPHAVSPDDFLKFLAGGAYTNDMRGLLKLISDDAPDFARDRALDVVVDVMPIILIDSARTGFQARANLMVQQSPTGETAYAIALSAGPAIYLKKKLFGGATALLPDSPRSYAAIHMPMPALEALKPDAVAVKTIKTDWGDTRLYADNSERAAFSDASMAGSLLRNLLRLDAHRFGWDASPYAAELYARQAQMMFYANAAAKAGNDDFLDADLKAAYHQWLEHPAEFRDFVVHTIASGRIQLLDPRKGDAVAQAAFDSSMLAACPRSLSDDDQERLALNRAALGATVSLFERLELISKKDLEAAKAGIESDLSSAAKKMGQPSMDACVKRWEGEASGLKQAAALLSEMEAAEGAFRKSHPPKGAPHAP